LIKGKPAVRSFAFIFIAFNSLVFNGCDSFYFDSEKIQNKFQSDLNLRPKKEIIVLTTQTGVSFYKKGSKVIGGIDHDLLSQFSKTYDIPIKFKVVKNEETALLELSEGKGDLATGRFSLNHLKKNSDLLVGPSIEESPLALFCKKKKGAFFFREFNKSISSGHGPT
jgi:membrane-bound lytic murein transglycosylase MltF